MATGEVGKLGRLIREARVKRGWSQGELAERAGTKQSTVDRIERVVTLHSRSTPAILRALEIDPTGLVPETTNIAMVRPTPKTAGLMPQFAAVEGGSGEMIVQKEPLGYVPRPHNLQNVEDAYSVLISGESMVPEFFPGDEANIDPRLPPLSDTTCVFYTNDPTDDRALIKHLLRPKQNAWWVRQWNPPDGVDAEFELDRADWPLCHRVVGRIPRR